MQSSLAGLVCLLLVVFLSVDAFVFQTNPLNTATYSSLQIPQNRLMAVMVDADHNKGTPITSDKFVFSEDNADLQWTRQRAFDRFQSIVEALAEMDDDNQVSLIWTNDREVNHQGVIPINSLLFYANDTPIVVISPSSCKVNLRKLEQHLELDNDNHDERIPNPKVKCSLVPADEVEELCGFPPMSVPPIGHVPTPLRIIVEESLYEKGYILLGGGGHPKIGCLIAAETLLRIEGTELADLTDEAVAVEDNLVEETPPSPLPQYTVIKPYFPLAPPALEDVQQILSHPDQPNPIKPIPLTIVGRINGVRKMAQRLVFVDLAPPDYVGTRTKLDSFDRPWLSPRDDQPMSIQLIAGKAFCKNRGEDAIEALKRFKVGQLILVEGKTNVGNRESLGHWADKRSLDIVVFDYRLLEEAPPKDPRVAPRIANTVVVESKPSPVPIATQQPPSSDILKLTDVLSENAVILVVEDHEGIADFQQSLDLLLTNDNGDDAPILTGIDCEWKPNFMIPPGEPQPVLLLQISLNALNKVYLFDLQTLLRPCLEPSESTNELEEATSEALTKIFDSPRFLKVGFQLMHDLQRLAGSYPHIPAFRSVTAVTEVSVVATKAMQINRIRNAKQLTSSLSRLTRYFTEKMINKDQQTSDWSCRPLAEAQREYGALDAAVAPLLLEKAMAMVDAKWIEESQIGRFKGDASFARAICSSRFLILENDNPATMRRLKAKRVVSDHWLVPQSWTTGRDTPSPPSAPTNEEEMYIDVGGTPRVPAFNLRVYDHPDANIVRDLAGKRLGKSKESCLDALLYNHGDFPEEAKLDFNQRSGYVEFADLVALFVNMPVRPGERSPRGYPNIWLEDGKYLTWYLRKNEWQEGTSDLAEKLQYGQGDSKASAILFVKTPRGHFLCCGRCQVSPSESVAEEKSNKKDWKLVELRLELLDRDALEDVDDFASMVFSKMDDSGSSSGSNKRHRTDSDALARAVLEGDFERARILALQLVPSDVDSNELRHETETEGITFATGGDAF